MANRYAVASGNWSNTATWDGGTLPTSADIVRPNNFNVTIDQDITVQALRNNATAPAVAGGTFTLTGNYTVNISLDIQCFATSLFTYNGTGTAYITGANLSAAIISSTTTDTTSTVIHSGTGTLIVDMVINSMISSEVNRFNIQVLGGGTLTCVKNVSLPNTSGSGTATSAISISGTIGATINLKGILGTQTTTGGTNANTRIVSCSTTATFNIVGNIIGPVTSSSQTVYALYITGSNCTINITGNVTSSTVSSQAFSNGIILIGTGNIITVNGNVTGVATGNASFNTAAINVNGANNTVNVAGTVTGGSSNTNGIVFSNIGVLVVNGTVIGGGAAAIGFSNGGTLSITGNITGGSTLAVSTNANTTITGIINGGTGNGGLGVNVLGGTLNHIGTIQASAFASGLGCNAPTTSTIICTGPFLRNGYVVAVASQTLRINALYNPYFEFKKSDTINVTYVDQSGSNFPAIANVRQGTSYASGLYTGTAIIPSASNVSQDIPVDNTVGTAQVSGQDLLDFISTSLDPMAVRLRNVSTVSTTGAQISSYNI